MILMIGSLVSLDLTFLSRRYHLLKNSIDIIYSPCYCPALIQIAEADAITPRRVAEKAAARMHNATVRIYAGGHFDPYVEPLFPSVIGDQLAFLAEHVPTPENHSKPMV